MEKFAKFIVSTIFGIITIIFAGYTIKTLWSWFIVSTFGMFTLTIPQAIGMGLLFSYMCPIFFTKEQYTDSGEWDTIFLDFIMRSVRSIFALLTGFIVKSFFLLA